MWGDAECGWIWSNHKISGESAGAEGVWNVVRILTRRASEGAAVENRRSNPALPRLRVGLVWGANKKLVSNLTDQNWLLLRGIARISEFKLEKFWTRCFEIAFAEAQIESRNNEGFAFYETKFSLRNLPLLWVVPASLGTREDAVECERLGRKSRGGVIE
jgi:hypothetical protein